jgi:hypothetical protein
MQTESFLRWRNFEVLFIAPEFGSRWRLLELVTQIRVTICEKPKLCWNIWEYIFPSLHVFGKILFPLFHVFYWKNIEKIFFPLFHVICFLFCFHLGFGHLPYK